MTLPIYTDKLGVEHAHSWDEVHEAARRVVEFFEWLKRQFINRDEMIDALMYALLLREHVLVFGESGTAKSAVVNAAVKGITGAILWEKQFTRFSTPIQVFGGIDARRLRESGEAHYITTNSLLEANIAIFDEFLDANPDFLRTLLNIIHERRFTNGSQVIETLPLRTVIATTNHNPAELLARDPRLRAVIDRFMFWVPIEQLFNEDDITKMVSLYQAGSQQSGMPTISLKDIDMISGVVRHLDLFNGDAAVMRMYSSVALQMRAEFAWFSDRHIAKVSKLLELIAILRGREFVDYEDIMIARGPLTRKFDDTDNPFDKITAEKLMHWRSTQEKIEHDPHMLALSLLKDRYVDYDASALAESDLIAAKRKIRDDRKQIMAMEGVSEEAGEMRTELANRLNSLEREVDVRISGDEEPI